MFVFDDYNWRHELLAIAVLSCLDTFIRMAPNFYVRKLPPAVHATLAEADQFALVDQQFKPTLNIDKLRKRLPRNEERASLSVQVDHNKAGAIPIHFPQELLPVALHPELTWILIWFVNQGCRQWLQMTYAQVDVEVDCDQGCPNFRPCFRQANVQSI